MKPFAAVIVALSFAFTTNPACARLTQAQLEETTRTPNPSAPLPLLSRFRDENGAVRTLGDVIGTTPALLVFADYTCRNLCGPMVEFAASGLQHSGLRPGKDFRYIVVGLDAKDTLDDAKALKTAHVKPGSPLFAATTFLSGDKATIAKITAAADYHFIYDNETDQFAHPAAAFVVKPNGGVVRVLSAIGLTGDDLRLSLIDAANGRIGSFADHIRLICYGFDPARGIYTLAITRLLMAGGLLTVGTLAAGIALMMHWSARELRS